MERFTVMSDIHLLIGGPFAVVLPLIGFISAIILVRYREDYDKCLMEKHGLTK